MSFERPTLLELVDRSKADLVSRLSLAGAVLRRSTVAVLARVIAGAAHMLHGHIEYQSKQILPDTADEAGVLRWGNLFGVDRNEATFFEGTATITGTNGLAAVGGELLVRADGKTYEIDADVTIAGGTGTVDITAVEAGTESNCDVGTELEFESPVSGVDSTAEVATATDGSDEEELEDYRASILERLREPPHGGNESDYVTWAKEVSGVTRAWCYPLELGAGTVTVRFMRDDDGSGASAIPSVGEVAEVQSYIDELAPVTAEVTVAAPVAVTRNFTIDGLSPDTSATRAAIQAELEDLIKTVEPGGTLLWSQMHEAIASATDVEDFALTSPAADVTYSTGQIPVLGTVTWT